MGESNTVGNCPTESTITQKQLNALSEARDYRQKLINDIATRVSALLPIMRSPQACRNEGTLAEGVFNLLESHIETLREDNAWLSDILDTLRKIV